MCGIVGIVGRDAVAGQLVEALRRLEYRGYDSAGIATLEHGRLERRRAEGKLANLERACATSRWPAPSASATPAGRRMAGPTRPTPIPHATARLAVVHNGIIENFRELKAELQGRRRALRERDRHRGGGPARQPRHGRGPRPGRGGGRRLPRLRGAFALGFIFAGDDDLLIGARHGAPLAIGFGAGETYLGSDALALAPFTDEITYLEEGDWAVLTRAGAEIRDVDGAPVTRQRQRIVAQAYRVEKGNHRHFMAKEIHEQPEVVGPHARPLRRPRQRPRRAARGPAVRLRAPLAPLDHRLRHRLLCRARRQVLVRDPGAAARRDRRRLGGPLPRAAARPGRADARHLAIGRDRRHPGLPALRQGPRPAHPGGGQRADLDHRARGLRRGPDAGRPRDRRRLDQGVLVPAHRAPVPRHRGGPGARHPQRERERDLVDALITVPGLMAEAIKNEGEIELLAREVAKARDVLYLGRGTSYPMALEGALKLKEISYIHAEGYAAGELKHGPIALIDESVPVIVIAPHDAVFEKTVSNMQEVAARGGRIILIGDAKGAAEAGLDTMATVTMPDLDPVVAPIVYAVPIQLIAYHTAVFMGKDVDQPRNLAKSVTVE